MRFIREKLGIIFIIAIFVASFTMLDAAQYDIALRMFLVLFLGAASALFLFFFGLDGIKKHARMSIILGLWVALVWISWYFSQTKNYGFSEAVIYSVAALVGISVTGIFAKHRRFLITMLIAFAVISSLYGFWFFTTHAETRMAGLFFDSFDYRHFFPNAFANFLLMTWPLLLLKAVNKKNMVAKITAAAVIFAALYLTFSRGAWVALIIQLMVLTALLPTFVIQSETIRKIVRACAVTISLTIVLIIGLLYVRNLNFSNISLGDKLTFQNSESTTSVEERKDFWLGSFALIQKSPLVGFGSMSFRYVFPPYQKHFLAISDHPHNWLLKMAVENGLPAALVFIVFLAGLLFLFIKKLGAHQRETVILAVAILGGFLHNMIDYNLNFIPNIFTFFIIVGCLLAYCETKKKRKTSSKISIGIWIVILVLTTTLSIKEIATTISLKLNPSMPYIYQKSFMPRDYFLGEAQKQLALSPDKSTPSAKYAKELLDIHLSKNPYDAYVWYLEGNATKALEKDPMNRLAYYRAYLEQNPNPPQEFMAKLRAVLAEYDRQFANNVHLTAFTDNPEEAAKIYDILGDKQKATSIRQQIETLRKSTAEKYQFKKEIGPRSLLNLIKGN